MHLGNALAAIRAAMDWAVAQKTKARQVVVSGFHSSLEQSVLEVRCWPQALRRWWCWRHVAGARLPLTLAVVSVQLGAPRLTAELAAPRNELVPSLAQCCVIAHAAQGAGLASRVTQWESDGRIVEWLAPGR